MRGREAAATLIAQQLKGLDLLVARGVQVKINSVLIPGINDAHLPEVNRVVREKGAILHNIMPLIARPEHGTHYGVTRQREPTAEELAAVRAACESSAGMLTSSPSFRAGRMSSDLNVGPVNAEVELDIGGGDHIKQEGSEVFDLVKASVRSPAGELFQWRSLWSTPPQGLSGSTVCL